jgi:hypothetical protein
MERALVREFGYASAMPPTACLDQGKAGCLLSGKPKADTKEEATILVRMTV